MDLSSPFLILDCQTTGMRPSVGSLLEFCWAVGDFSAFDVVVSGGLVELPAGADIPPRVREITGIRLSDMSEARAIDLIRAEFLVAVAALGARPVALIHYAQFEEAWVRDLLGSAELPFDILCTHRISKKLLPTVPSRNIRGLTGYFGMRIGEIKRAHQHVTATHKIWSGLVPMLASLGLHTVADVRAWLAEKPAKAPRARGGADAAGGAGAAAAKKPRAPSYEYRVDRSKRLALPDKPGIYKMIAKSGEILYVGKATCLKDRVNSYFRGKKGRDPRKLEMMAQVWDLEIVECGSAIEAALVESDEIKRLNPPYNVSLKEGNRALLYYDRALEKESLVQSAENPVGPFRRFNSIEHLRVFAGGLKENVVYNVFYQPIEPSVLEAGYALFEEKYPLRVETMSVRDHLAFALRHLRAEAGEPVSGDGDSDGDAQQSPDDGDQLPVVDLKAAIEAIEAEIEANDEDEEITAEDVCEKIEKLYLRAATTYLRAKEITRLLWSDVKWTERGEEKSLRVRGGKLLADESERPTRGQSPWAGLAISDYDRMSVLLMEISKIDHEVEPLR